MASNSAQRPISKPGGGSTVLDREGSCWKTLHLETGLCHTTQTGEPSVGNEEISVTTSLLASNHQTLQTAIPFDYYA